MSIWDQRVIEHRVMNDIRVAKRKIEGIVVATGGDNTVVLESKARLLAILDRLQKSLANVDPYFVPVQVLDDISRSLDATVQSLDDYRASPETDHLTTANVAAESILRQLSLLSLPRPAEEVEDLQIAAASLKRTLDQDSRLLRGQLKELADDLSELRQAIARENSRLRGGDSE